jgi:hypothetical protein
MTRTNHTRGQLVKATAAAIATAVLLVPGALANSSAQNNHYDPWFNNAIATQRSQPDPWFNNALATQRSQPDPWFNNAIAKQRSLATQTNNAKQTGYRFMSDTLGGNGQPTTSAYRFISDTLAPGGGSSANSVAAASSHGFDWADAGVGAAATLGLALLILTGRVVALRKRGGLAF